MVQNQLRSLRPPIRSAVTKLGNATFNYGVIVKYAILVLAAALSASAFAATGTLTCSFDGGNIEATGKYDGKIWHIKQIADDDWGYEIEGKVLDAGALNFYIDTADETGGDPDYTYIYDIQVLGALNKGATVDATVEYAYYSRGDGIPETYSGTCTLK